MDTLESKVCELMGSGNATVNTDVSTLGKKKHMEVVQVWEYCMCVNYTASHFKSNLMIEGEGLDPYVFPHQSKLHSFCLPKS